MCHVTTFRNQYEIVQPGLLVAMASSTAPEAEAVFRSGMLEEA